MGDLYIVRLLIVLCQLLPTGVDSVTRDRFGKKGILENSISVWKGTSKNSAAHLRVVGKRPAGAG